jgi:hypothetical protein
VAHLRSQIPRALLLALFMLLSPFATARRASPTQLSSAYGVAGQSSFWLLNSGNVSINDIPVNTETVCPGGTENGVCSFNYLFLYQIPAGPNNLVLTFSGLSGFAFNAATPSFGVLLCDPPGASGNMLCTQNLTSADIDNLNINFDASAGNLVITVPSIPAGDTITFFINELPSVSGTLPVALSAPALNLGGAIISPPAITFGSQEVGNSSIPQTVTVLNSGDFSTTLNVSEVSATSGFSVSGSCPALPPGAVCALPVVFVPVTPDSSAGALTTGFLTVTDNSPTAAEAGLLSGTANSAGVQVSPSTLVFGSQVVETTSASQSVTITNSSGSPLNIASITPAVDVYTAASDFSIQQDGCSGNTIPPLGSCQVSIAFAPTFSGSLVSTMAVTDNSIDGFHTIELGGMANSTNSATASISNLRFGQQGLGTRSAPQTVTLTNSSTLPLTIVSVNVTAAFIISSDNCTPASPLPAGNSCTVSVEFNPPILGLLNGWLTIADDSVDGTILVPLTGTGMPTFAVSASPTSLSLVAGAGNTSTVSVTPSNGFTGNVALTCAVTGPTGATSPAACALNPTTADVTGSAAVTSVLTIATTATTTIGTYPVTVTGTQGSITSTAIVNVTITAAVVTSSFTITSTAVAISGPGATTGNTSTITVTPSGNFTGSVALTAVLASGPSGANTEFDPTFSFGSTTPVSITSTAAGTATMTISTTAPANAALSHLLPPVFPWYSLSGTGLAFLVIFCPCFPVRGRKRRARFGLLVLLVAIVGSSISCGGSNTSSGGGTPGTTPGSYTVTVTGTSGGTTVSATVSITVD